MTSELDSLKEHYNRCVRCGQCRSVCPVFSRLKTESSSPRAKVFLSYLLACGGTSKSREAQRLLSLCLLCRSCTAECPSAVPVHRLVTAARARAALGWSDPLKNVLAKSFFTHPDILALGLSALSLCRPVFAVPGLKEFLSPLFPFGQAALKHRAKKILPALTLSAGRTRLRVAYFIGCLTDICFPEVARHTVSVLSSLGCEVIVLKNTGCCGAPLAARGQKEAAAHLAHSSLSAAASTGADAVVTDCPTCALNLTEGVQEYLDKNLKVYEALQLAAELQSLAGIDLPKTGTAVTCHYPCHLTHALRAAEATRQVLKSTCPDFRELPKDSGCCGGGGSFFLTHRQLSSRILKDKVRDIEKTGARTIATSCPLCQIQIRRGLNEAKYRALVVHPIQLIKPEIKISAAR